MLDDGARDGVTSSLGREGEMATVVVTGTNRGIGLELVRAFVARGDRVVAACRRPSEALAASGAEVAEGVDVTDEDSIRAFASGLAGTSVDVLVNNAGLLSRETLDDLDAERIRRQLEVNALGPVRVTAALRGSLPAGAKVAVVTSRMGSIADNGSGGMYGYRMSKAAANAGAVSLARDLHPAGVAVCALHPGFVRTEMTGGRGHIDAAQAAAGLIARIDALSLATTGRFWHMNGEELPW